MPGHGRKINLGKKYLEAVSARGDMNEEAESEDGSLSAEERDRLEREEREQERIAREAEAERLAIEQRKLAKERREKAKNEKLRKQVVRMNEESARQASKTNSRPAFNEIQRQLTTTKHEQRRVRARANLLADEHKKPRKKLHERLVCPSEETPEEKHKHYHENVCKVIRREKPELEQKLWEQYILFARSSDAAEEWAAKNFFDFLMTIGRKFVTAVLFDFIHLLPAASVSKRRALIKIATPDFTELIEERLPQWKAAEWKPLFNPTSETMRKVPVNVRVFVCVCPCVRVFVCMSVCSCALHAMYKTRAVTPTPIDTTNTWGKSNLFKGSKRADQAGGADTPGGTSPPVGWSRGTAQALAREPGSWGVHPATLETSAVRLCVRGAQRAVWQIGRTGVTAVYSDGAADQPSAGAPLHPSPPLSTPLHLSPPLSTSLHPSPPLSTPLHPSPPLSTPTPF
jgi:hypothetical protein